MFGYSLREIFILVVQIFFVFLLTGIKKLPEHERAVIIRRGRVVPTRGPGQIYVIPLFERMVRVDLRTTTVEETIEQLQAEGKIKD